MRSKKVVSMVIVLMMLLIQTSGSFAAIAFSDVEKQHWAKEYIEEMAEKKIVSGYMDENLRIVFKPDDAVTKPQAIKMIYEVLKASGKLKTNGSLVSKYENTMKQYEIPQWAYEAIAYAIEYKILHPDDIKAFVQNEVQNEAKRVDVAIFLGKALDMEDEIDPLATLNFLDAEMIITPAIPYVHLLEKKGVISGDTTNKFNPNDSVTRAQMAKMCATAFELLEGEEKEEDKDIVTPVPPVVDPIPTIPVIPVEPEEEEESEYTVKFGEIYDIITSTKQILIQDEKGMIQPYSQDDEVEVWINDEKSSFVYLKKGQKVSLNFDDKQNLVKIEVNDRVTDFEGMIDGLIAVNGEYLMTVENDEGERKTFKVNDETDIEIDGKIAETEALKKGDAVSLRVKDNVAIEVIIESKDRDYDGVIEEGLRLNKIKVKLNNGIIQEFEIDKSVKVKRNDRSADLEDLIKGDIVKVHTEFDKVVSIYAQSIENANEGMITAIVIGDPSKITIVTDEEDEKTYEIGRKVEIEIDNKDATLYDLRMNHYVELTIEGDVVTEIEAKTDNEGEYVIGDIKDVYTRTDEFVVKTFNVSTNRYEDVEVSVSRDTSIYYVTSARVKTIELDDLDEEDKVFIEGYYRDNVFHAEKIILLIRN